MNALQLEHVMAHAGCPRRLQVAFAAVGLAETGGGVHPLGDYYRGQGYTSFGVWQIHTRDEHGHAVNVQPNGHPYNEHRLATDPLYNAKAALNVLHSQGWNAWSTHLYHQDRAFLPAARWASGHDERLHWRAAQHALRLKLQHRHHVAHPVKPTIAPDPLAALPWQFVGALGLMLAFNVLRQIPRVFGVAIRQEVAIIKRSSRRKRYQADAAYRKRTMPRAQRRIALA